MKLTTFTQLSLFALGSVIAGGCAIDYDDEENVDQATSAVQAPKCVSQKRFDYYVAKCEANSAPACVTSFSVMEACTTHGGESQPCQDAFQACYDKQSAACSDMLSSKIQTCEPVCVTDEKADAFIEMCQAKAAPSCVTSYNVMVECTTNGAESQACEDAYQACYDAQEQQCAEMIKAKSCNALVEACEAKLAPACDTSYDVMVACTTNGGESQACADAYQACYDKQSSFCAQLAVNAQQ